MIFEGKTTQEAIEKGLKELHVNKNEVDIKILEEKKKSFFSILDPHIVRIEMTTKEGVNPEKRREEPELKEDIVVSEETLKKGKEAIRTFLDQLLKQISENVTGQVEIEENCLMVNINGEGSAKLIGYRGETLNALQTILLSVVKNQVNESVRVILDIEGYRKKREKTLEELASKLEKTVMRNGKNVTLEPMSPYERKIIHTTLQNSRNVKTYSIGEGEHRRIVVSKK